MAGKWSISESSTASITTSSSKIINRNLERKYLVVRNRGSNTIYLSVGNNQPAVVGSGIMLLPNEGWEMSDINIGTGSVQAICDGGTSDVCIFEASR
jgi:hypothetical protein